MIFLGNNNTNNFEEEEEVEAGIDDTLLGELDETLEDDDLIEGELDPLAKASIPDPIAPEDDDLAKEDLLKVFEEDEDEDVDDYDSFDDRDEM